MLPVLEYYMSVEKEEIWNRKTDDDDVFDSKGGIISEGISNFIPSQINELMIYPLDLLKPNT